MVFEKGMIFKESRHGSSPLLAIFQIVGRHDGEWVLADIDERSNEVRIRSTEDLNYDIEIGHLVHFASYKGYMDAK